MLTSASYLDLAMFLKVFAYRSHRIRPLVFHAMGHISITKSELKENIVVNSFIEPLSSTKEPSLLDYIHNFDKVVYITLRVR